MNRTRGVATELHLHVGGWMTRGRDKLNRCTEWADSTTRTCVPIVSLTTDCLMIALAVATVKEHHSPRRGGTVSPH